MGHYVLARIGNWVEAKEGSSLLFPRVVFTLIYAPILTMTVRWNIFSIFGFNSPLHGTCLIINYYILSTKKFETCVFYSTFLFRKKTNKSNKIKLIQLSICDEEKKAQFS